MSNEMEQTGTVRLAALADQLVEAQGRVQLAEAELATAKREVQRLEEEVIPSIMDDLQLAELKTVGGLVLKVGNALSAKQLTEKHVVALKWLRDNGEAGCIKTEVVVPFAAGSDADADQLVDQLAGEGIAASKGITVHPSTLGALLRRRLEAGDAVPLDAFGAYQRRVAKVEVSK